MQKRRGPLPSVRKTAGTPEKRDPNDSAVRNRNAVSREDPSEGSVSPELGPGAFTLFTATDISRFPEDILEEMT